MNDATINSANIPIVDGTEIIMTLAVLSSLSKIEVFITTT